MRRRDEVLVGLFTTVAVIVAALASIWLVRGGLEKGYPLYTRFPWGAGLKQGQPVWLVGVTAGFVDKVELDPRGTLLVTLRIQRDYQVPVTSTASIMPNGFFGDMAVALTPQQPTEAAFAPGDTIPAGVSYTGLATLTARADTLTAGLSAILTALRQQLVDSGGLNEIRRASLSANRLFTNFSDIATVQSRELQLTLGSARTRLSAIDSAQIDSTVRALNVFASNLRTISADLRTTTERFNALVAKAESGEGSLGKLLADPALYNDMRRVMARVDSVLADFAANPRKYLKFSIW